MRRMIGAGLLGLLLLVPSGCIAVSAKEIHSGMRYEAVAARDGKIYVVDKRKMTACRVAIVEEEEFDEP